MNEKQRENEEKIFDAIQILKDSIFGLKQPYTRFCYSYTEDGLTFDRGKVKRFVAEMSEFSRHTTSFDEELEPVMPLFFEMCAMLLDAICGKGDWVFVSFRKIAETAMKYSPEEESVLERIVANHREEIGESFPDGSFHSVFEAFGFYMGRVDANRFYYSVKHALEAYLDEHRLNVLDRDKMTESAVARINRLASAIERDLNRAEDFWEGDE